MSINTEIKTGNPIVDEVGMLNLSGNVIPETWYQTIISDKGKVNCLAIFGDTFSKHVPVNLILVFLLVQPVYLLVLIFLDCHYESKGLSDKWKLKQNA